MAKKNKNNQDELTYSRLSTFLKCPRMEYYQYRVNGVGIKPTAPYIPFIEGDLGHYALYHFYNSGRMLRDNLQKRVKKMIDELGPLDPDTDDALNVKLAALMGACLGYKQVYHDNVGENGKYENILLEAPFEFDFDGITIRGKIDRLNRDKETGKTILWENKFVASATAQNYTALPMDLQGFIYCEGVKVLTGEYPDFKAWDFILKSQLRRKKDKQGGKESLLSFEARVQDQYVQEPEKKLFRPPPLPVYKTMLGTLKKELKKIIKRFNEGETEMGFSDCLGTFNQPCTFIQACTEKLKDHEDGWDAPACRGMYKLKETLHEELDKEDDKEDNKKETEETDEKK